MEFIWVTLIIISSVYLLIYLIFSLQSGRPFSVLIISVAIAAAVLLIINLTDVYTGFHIPVNYGTFVLLTFFGLPGAVLIYVIESFL